MTVENLQTICMALPGVTQDIKWEDHLCFNVGEKMFLVTSPDKLPPTASFKVPAGDFEEICEQDGFTPAPYLARYKWVFIDDIGRLSQQQWKAHIEQSYQLIFSKLPTKIRKQISI